MPREPDERDVPQIWNNLIESLNGIQGVITTYNYLSAKDLTILRQSFEDPKKDLTKLIKKIQEDLDRKNMEN
ncbi:hypothetical protein BW152_03635 [Lactococcus lactis]|uniref:hypothetical protein n=1 Tax=Lactococcus lactis TaxID=1358 RepID=UPI000BF70E73|nr:hypothetical protein [Lactococcus lactis]PFG84662.1 hypothetical protein BW152_03635 [Lactococcus lactis]